MALTNIVFFFRYVGQEDKMSEKGNTVPEVFEERNFIFGCKHFFDDVFPEVDSILVTVCETGRGVNDGANRRSYNRNNLGEFIDCSNPDCYNGGFSLDLIIGWMVDKRESHRDLHELCQGYERTPEENLFYRRCTNSFRISVDIQYSKSYGSMMDLKS
jgi:hypothetical protein